MPGVDSTTNRFTLNQGYSYDKNGNVINDPVSNGRAFTFDGNNKQTLVKNSSGGVIGRYFYDANGKRVKKVSFEGTNNEEIVVFVYDAGGKLIAEYSNKTAVAPTVSYTATDPLGSPRIITDKQGNIVSRRDFMPFGEDLSAGIGSRSTTDSYGSGNDNLRKRFTGYEKDQETGLDFAEARYYNNEHGRFTAVDPLLASGKSSNPQTFNRYVYVLNNPLVLTDKSGLQAGSDDTPIGTTNSAAFDSWSKAFSYYFELGSNYLKDFLANNSLEASPLKRANHERFQNLMSGYPEGPSPRIAGALGPRVDSILQKTSDGIKLGHTIIDTGLTIQGLLSSVPTPGARSTVTRNFGTPIFSTNEAAAAETTVGAFSTSEFKFTDVIRKASLKQNANSIFQNGVQQPIDFAVINGEKYILNGNHRTVLSMIFRQPTIPAQQQVLPFGSWRSEEEVLLNNAQYGNPFTSPSVRAFRNFWEPPN